jgi:hypothetical protein
MSILRLLSALLAALLISAPTFSFEGKQEEGAIKVESPFAENWQNDLELEPLEIELQNLDTKAKQEMEANGKVRPATDRKLTRVRSTLCEQGKRWYCPGVHLEAKNVDIDALAYAVAVAETSNCTTGTALSRNNCFGIKQCKAGKCNMKVYATKEDSFNDFKYLWINKYGDHFPTLSDAAKYSGGPGDTWLNRVTIAYNRKLNSKID